MENLGNKPGIAGALNNLGIIHFKYKRDTQKSLELLQRALEIYKELKIPQLITETEKSIDIIKKQANLKG